MIGRDPKELLASAQRSDRVALARLVSIVERGGEPAMELTKLTHSINARPYVVGITGAPGAGKSTLTDRLVSSVRETSQQVAVVAIDPTSPFSGGAILGDRVRMQDHASDPGVFIRSMATRGHLGGLALAVPDAVRVLGAAGFPYIFIETVGVGQVEVEIVGTADTTVVVVTPGWGDSVQVNKAGLMEIADLFVINKADRPGVRETRRDIDMMLEMSNIQDWVPKIVETIATSDSGTRDLLAAVESHHGYLKRSGAGEKKREDRTVDELRRIVTSRLSHSVEKALLDQNFVEDRKRLLEGKIDPYSLAEEILKDRISIQ